MTTNEDKKTLVSSYSGPNPTYRPSLSIYSRNAKKYETGYKMKRKFDAILTFIKKDDKSISILLQKMQLEVFPEKNWDGKGKNLIKNKTKMQCEFFLSG